MMHKQFTGFTLIILGTLVLLQSLSIFNFGLTFWPAVLIWIGLEMVWGSLFHRWHGSSLFGALLGLLVAGVGVEKILVNLGVVAPMGLGGLIHVGWPILLVLLGLSILFGQHRIRVERH